MTGSTAPEWFQSTPSGGKATFPRAGEDRQKNVSIHAFRGEGDLSLAREAVAAGIVSIHAFRGEGDPPRSASAGRAPRFNPRLPGGRRQDAGANRVLINKFQSTPSGGKATRLGYWCASLRRSFNPRLPGGRRRQANVAGRRSPGFNPRLPGGRRPTCLP